MSRHHSTLPSRPYKALRHAIQNLPLRNRRIYSALTGIIGGFLITYFLFQDLFSRDLPFDVDAFRLVFRSILLIVIIFLAVECISLSTEITGDRNSDKYVDAIIVLIKKNKLDEETLSIIDERAEIGTTAGGIRTLIPILLFPILISISPQFESTYWDEQLSIGAISLFILYMLLREIHYANIDIDIRHAITEYRHETKKRRQLQQQQQDDELVRKMLQQQISAPKK